MRLQAWLFLVYLLIVSDMIAGAIGGYTLWRYRNGDRDPITKYLAFVLFALFIDGVALFVANAFGFTTRPVFSAGYAWAFWTGKAIRSFAVWWFVLYILGYRPRRGPE